MQYEQIIDGYYEGGEVKGIDMLNFKPLTKDYFKSRPDMKQRVEKAINTQTYLAAYQRGTRLGYKWITQEEQTNYMDGALNDNSPIEGAKVTKLVSDFKHAEPPKDFFIDKLKWKFLVRNIEKAKI